MCHGKIEHADGYYFRFKDPKVAQVHALKLGTIGQIDDDDGAPPTEAEMKLAQRLGLEPGVSEVLYKFGSYWEVGVFVQAIIHNSAPVTLGATVSIEEEGAALKDSKETDSKADKAAKVVEKNPDFRFSFKDGSFKRNFTELETMAALLVPPTMSPPLPPWPRNADSAAKYA